jgi:hypothetical protein
MSKEGAEQSINEDNTRLLGDARYHYFDSLCNRHVFSTQDTGEFVAIKKFKESESGE